MKKLHLIMPMGGRGYRFFKDGYSMPKPLIELNGKPFFYCYSRGDEIVRQSVLLGINNGSIVEIRDGVKSGETILIPATSDFELPMMRMMR